MNIGDVNSINFLAIVMVQINRIFYSREPTWQKGWIHWDMRVPIKKILETLFIYILAEKEMDRKEHLVPFETLTFKGPTKCCCS